MLQLVLTDFTLKTKKFLKSIGLFPNSENVYISFLYSQESWTGLLSFTYDLQANLIRKKHERWKHTKRSIKFEDLPITNKPFLYHRTSLLSTEGLPDDVKKLLANTLERIVQE